MIKQVVKSVLLGFTLSYAISANALDVDRLELLTQPEFDLLTKDLGAALSYKSVSPAEPLGITGIDIGLEASYTKLENSSILNKATGENVSALVIPKVHIHKGLPFDIDIGASLTKVGDLQLLGGELKYAILEGGMAMPALAIRGTYSTLSGIEDIDLTSTGAELAISKGFLMLTAFGGAGRVWTTATPKSTTATALFTKSKQAQNKLFAGVNLNLGLINFAVEAEKTGDTTGYNAKVGFRF